MNQQPYGPLNQQPQQLQQSQQPYQNQIPNQYQPQPGAPQPGGPGFPQKPQRPGWVVPLVIVAVVGVVLSALLGGILIGGNLNTRSGQPETVSSSEMVISSQPSLPQETVSSAPESVPASEPSSSAQTPEIIQGPGPVLSFGNSLDDAIDWIEDSATFAENYTFEPLGCVDDFDGDGNQDFLAAYETKAANGTWSVSYALFALLEDEPKLLDDGILYQEVGGNSGSVGIAKGKDGAVYLVRCVKQATGDTMNTQYVYIPWDSVGTADEANSYCMEARWNVDDPDGGTYLLGDTKVDRDRFETSRENYTVLYELNIVAGHGNGLENGADFDTLEKWYGD